jgi:hypothetical protein
MSIVEIEAAIKNQPPSEREQLAEALPFILPELRGDLIWQRIINDERARPLLSAFGDDVRDSVQDRTQRISEKQRP